MDYKGHKEHFDIAYRTGSDFWTNLFSKDKEKILIEELPQGSLILDIGSGRGLFAKKLAESGFSVIGLDFEKNIIDKTNNEINNWGLSGKLKFVEGDVLDIPFIDSSFDAVCDFGLIENLDKNDWSKYKDEVNRVLKSGGLYLNVSLSKDTQNFFEFSPKNSEDGDFEKYNIHYHFFTKEEIKNIFKNELDMINQKIEFVKGPNDVVIIETLFRKK